MTGPRVGGGSIAAAALESSIYAATVGSAEISRWQDARAGFREWWNADSPLADVVVTQDHVAGVSSSGLVTLIRPATGVVETVHSAGIDVSEAYAAPEGLWLMSADRGDVVYLDTDLSVRRRTRVDPIAHAGVSETGLWFTSAGSTHLTQVTVESGGDRLIDIDMTAKPVTALAVCGNSIWLSGGQGLVRVDPRSGRVHDVPNSEIGEVTHLMCVGYGLLAGDALDRLFVMAFAGDSDARRVETDRSDPIARLVTDGRHAWALVDGGDRLEAVPI